MICKHTHFNHTCYLLDRFQWLKCTQAPGLHYNSLYFRDSDLFSSVWFRTFRFNIGILSILLAWTPSQKIQKHILVINVVNAILPISTFCSISSFLYNWILVETKKTFMPLFIKKKKEKKRKLFIHVQYSPLDSIFHI